MSLGYSTIAVGLSINDGRQPGVEYNLDGESVANGVFNAMTAFGTIAFAYGGHNVVLEIQVSKIRALRCRLSSKVGTVIGLSAAKYVIASPTPQVLLAMLQATLPSPPSTLRPYMRGVYLACEHLATACFATRLSTPINIAHLAVQHLWFCLLSIERNPWPCRWHRQLVLCWRGLLRCSTVSTVSHLHALQAAYVAASEQVPQPRHTSCTCTAGYWAYGRNVSENILFSLDHPRGIIALAAMMVLLHVTGSYQVYSMPVSWLKWMRMRAPEPRCRVCASGRTCITTEQVKTRGAVHRSADLDTFPSCSADLWWALMLMRGVHECQLTCTPVLHAHLLQLVHPWRKLTGGQTDVLCDMQTWSRRCCYSAASRERFLSDLYTARCIVSSLVRPAYLHSDLLTC